MTQDINIKVNAQNNASPVLKKVQQDIGGLDKAAGVASGGLGALGKGAGLAGLVALGVQAGQAAVELAQLGAQSLALKSSFEQVQGGAANATAILESLRSASRGMISDYDLMLAANKAALLGVADTAEEMSGLLQIASVRGRAMGVSATQAFNDIVTGLGRMSPLILDNLGITVDLDRATQEYAASLGKTSAALTDAERKQALVNAVIASSADLMADANQSAETLAGQGFAQLDAAWRNFRATLGESLAPLFDAAASQVAAGIDKIRAEIDKQNENEALRRQLQDAGATSTSMALAGIDDPGAMQRILKEQGGGELSGFGDSLRSTLAEYQAAIDKFIEASKSGNATATREAIVNMQMYGEAVDELGRKYNGLAEILGKPTVDLNRLNSGDLVFDMTAVYENLPGAIRPAAEELANLNAEIGKTNTDEFTKSFETAAQAIEEVEPKLRALYGTLLDTGDIEGAGKAYAQIQAIIQEITAEWVRQGIPIENIKKDLLPKLIGELDNLIGKQVEAGSAGINAGDAIGSGFLAAIPAIQLVIGVVNALTGAAGAAAAAVGRATQVGATRWNPNTRGNRGNAAGMTPSWGGASLGRNASDTGTSGAFGKLDDLYSRRMAGIGGRSIATDMIRVGGGAGSGGGGGAVDSTVNQLAGRIKSVLQGALKSGIDVDALLPRQDAVEENARRLADVAVRGYDSPWASYFQEKFPDLWAEISAGGDIKSAAAGILRDFEDGLRPELLDKDRAKDLVRRAILGDQNMTNLANEIAAELSSELGISLEAAQQAAQGTLGVGGGDSGIGATFADGAVTGVTDNNAGGRMVTALIAQLGIKDNLDSIYVAGESYGAQWGSGFLASVSTNVPGALIAVLVAAVTPGVQSALATQGSRTGATGSTGGAI